jgi:hypothetical protein
MQLLKNDLVLFVMALKKVLKMSKDPDTFAYVTVKNVELFITSLHQSVDIKSVAKFVDVELPPYCGNLHLSLNNLDIILNSAVENLKDGIKSQYIIEKYLNIEEFNGLQTRQLLKDIMHSYIRSLNDNVILTSSIIGHREEEQKKKQERRKRQKQNRKDRKCQE